MNGIPRLSHTDRPPPVPMPPLHRAALVGDHDEIRRLVAAGQDVDDLVDIRTDPGALERLATPLMVAAGSTEGAAVDTVSLLLELGASVAPGPAGVSALSTACDGLSPGSGPVDAARIALLLESGSDPNVVGYGGFPTPVLACVARAGDPERVRLLLDAGADAAPDLLASLTGREARSGVYCGRLALHRAAASGSDECVRMLLAAGAPARDDGADHSVLACATSTVMLVDLIGAGADPHALGPRHGSIAREVAQNRRVSVEERTAMLRALVAVGVDLDEPERCAILVSAMNGDDSAVEALLDAGANPRVGEGALSTACFSYCPDLNPRMQRVIDLLIAAGFDANEHDADGYTPLHAALSPDAFGGGYQESDDINVAAAAALIRHGASVDIVFPNFDGFGPLHIAALQCSAPAIEVLLEAGADPNQLSPAGQTALDIARAQLALGREPSAHHDAAECVRRLEAATG